ncbi:zona pellucida sperm-binding protein 4-like [Bufo bufo]|uniref:zona pellucida sperm-binding protein 4-like n=1 Tax=Bufo bufo TaxID=8384 RepID=UPI001ABE1A5A|nr:zona pellucida sperm-binding protein 4-like [Bufo bufo]
MAGSWCRVWLVLLLVGGCFAASAQNGFYEEPLLICGDYSLEYTLQLLATNISTRLSVYDADANGTPLVTNKSCGVSITAESDGYVVIHAKYNGCYMQIMENKYMMTIFLEVNTTGEWEVYQKEDLMCPVHLVHDAPSPSECSDVSIQNRLVCARPPVSQDACLQNGCCYDQTDSRTPCYYGNRVTAQCTADGRLSVAVSSGVTWPSLILPSVRFTRASGAECGPVAQNNYFLLFSFPLSACGTTQTVQGGNVIYENDMMADKMVSTWRGSSITRDSTFSLHIRCSFIGSELVPLSVEVFTLPPPPPASSQGQLNLQMRIALDAAYSQYYADEDYPLVKVLRDPVFVEVHIVNRNDPGLVLMLDQCWATASVNPDELPQWPILVDGCPFEGDNYKTQLQAVADPSLQFPLYYKRFIVSTFTFVNSATQASLTGQVYLHCSASVCVPSSQVQCVTICPMRRRRALNLEPVSVVSADGPIYFYMDESQQLSEGHQEEGNHLRLDWIWAVVAGSVVGIVIMAVWLKKLNGYTIKDVNI